MKRFSHPSPDPSFRERREEISATPTEVDVQRTSEILGEAILASSYRVRDSLPEQHREHFETLRQEIIDFAQAHNIPRESLSKPEALREAASKLSTPDLEQLANLLERFEYLLKNKEPKKEKLLEALEYAEEFYHLKKQYDLQVELLERAGILDNGAILGIDGNEYLVPTLEQIASRLFERRETLKIKHDQGFTKLLLVPFGMSLDSLRKVLKQFLLEHQKNDPSFHPDVNGPLWIWEEGYEGADIGDSPKLVYKPQSFTEEGHGGKTKMQILEEQEDNQDSFPGWTVHLLQPSNLDKQNTETPVGFASIPRQGQGASQRDFAPRLFFSKRRNRPLLETNKTPHEYLSLLRKAQEHPTSSPYFQESGMTPEDWIMAFMIHLRETGRFLDDFQNPINTEGHSCLVGAFFPSFVNVPCAYWYRQAQRINFGGYTSFNHHEDIGARFSVIV